MSWHPYIPQEWQNTIIVGDSGFLMKALPDESINLTVTSPPYGDLRSYKGYSFNFPQIANELYRVTEEGGVVVWVVGDETKDYDESGESFRQALYFKEIGFCLYDTIIYAKNQFRFPRERAYHNIFEYMFVLSKGRPKTVNLIMDRKNDEEYNKTNGAARLHMKREKDGSFTGRKAFQTREYGVRYNIWTYSVGSAVSEDKFAFEHPAIFPENLAADHIMSWSNPGDVVLDCFSGSGTTLKKAQELGRNFIGMEISEDYAEKIGKRRIRIAKVPLFV